ncbi:hypothetical protein Mapa_007797 [Marchantia paleacea]|nr:hypothetical protein Mapa_007797 [Marchantia paleacea]
MSESQGCRKLCPEIQKRNSPSPQCCLSPSLSKIQSIDRSIPLLCVLACSCSFLHQTLLLLLLLSLSSSSSAVRQQHQTHGPKFQMGIVGRANPAYGAIRYRDSRRLLFGLQWMP